MIFSLNNGHIFKIALAVFFLASCSDIFLQSDRGPSVLELKPDQVEMFVGDKIDFNLTIKDETGNPFKIGPGWLDTLYSFPKAKIALNKNRTFFKALKAGETELKVKAAGMTESMNIFARPRVGMTQSIQCVRCASGRIQIVAGRGGAIRLFLKGKERSINNKNVSLVIYENGSPVKTLDYFSENLALTPTEDPDISILYIPIPGSYLETNLSVIIKIGNNLTYPENGTPSPIHVIEVPGFHIRLIPIHVAATGKTGHVNSGNTDEYVEKLLDLYPINNYSVDIHSPVTVNISPESGSFYEDVLKIISKLWINEGKPDYYYYGVIPKPEKIKDGYILGTGYIGKANPNVFRQAVGFDNKYTVFTGEKYTASGTLAHELGHNMGRPHTPCGGAAGADSNYPYMDGSIGVYGYEADEGEIKPPSKYKDIMSYCYPQWISDYTYAKVLNFRFEANNAIANVQPRDVLLVSGSINNDKLTLDPAFRIKAPPVLPEQFGPYTLTGFDKSGGQLFSISFAGARIAHSNTRSFTFAIPVERVHITKLKTLRLTGRNLSAMQQSNKTAQALQNKAKALPDISVRKVGANTVSLKWNSSNYQAIMVENAQTGEVLGFTNGGISEIKTDARQLKLYFSDGVHTTTARISVQ